MTPWEDHVAYLRETFINGLVHRGLRLIRDDSKGALSDVTLLGERVAVTLGMGFPYLPPTVSARVEIPKTWHQERNGNLCLYAIRDRDNQPWLDPDEFIERVDLWFEKNDLGWPDDPPVLDIEAYLDLPLETRLVIYSGLGQLKEPHIRIRDNQQILRTAGPGKAAKNNTKGLLTGYVTDGGEVASPPRNWHDLITNADEVERIERSIKRGRIDVLLIRYRRNTQQGVLAITFKKARKVNPQPHVAFSASADPSAMELRAGANAHRIADKHVYVVGAGALGSHICDGLSRAGIGKLTIRDADYLIPGNMTRHLVTDIQRCGVSKAQAVKADLEHRPYNRAAIIADTTALQNPEEGARLFTECDLVVDATADGAVTAMLEGAARATGHRLITACLQNEGRTRRVDIVPPFDGADSIPPITPRPSDSPEAFEAGCGEPVSTTPPYAVAEAAVMAVRHIIGCLIGEPPTAAGEVRDS